MHKELCFLYIKPGNFFFIGNKLPILILPKVWSRLMQSICTRFSFLSLCMVHFPVWPSHIAAGWMMDKWVMDIWMMGGQIGRCIDIDIPVHVPAWKSAYTFALLSFWTPLNVLSTHRLSCVHWCISCILILNDLKTCICLLYVYGESMSYFVKVVGKIQ